MHESTGEYTPANVRIGCAGWSILSRHGAHFDAGESHLARYATRFDMVEINSSFYRPHAFATYARWAAAVPPGFRFSVKLPKSITHEARLHAVGGLLSGFAESIAGLGNRLGGVLVQLPPSLAFDARTADTFFAMLRRRISVPVACEPRHASWFEPRVDATWQRHDVSRVAADPAILPQAALPGGKGGWSYWRWHGSPRMYYDAYGPGRLADLASGLIGIASPRRPAWCIFDNTAGGHAIADAVQLQQLVGSRSAARAKAKPRAAGDFVSKSSP
ncbi:DUF72 domain-containing protein [Cognatiluteimonas profundi]|uniref:DUF72 domain-containing protein n=1 Tax=Cognatiluteimonas profundi TaxID=2594501 RepID=UPI00131C01C2|nr:DUF72 domain-containing protein [Lysobacter profundi]